jgi:SWI/SNF-related matrix-associated actin-dependent regulator of chromatin subfamily A member 5
MSPHQPTSQGSPLKNTVVENASYVVDSSKATDTPTEARSNLEDANVVGDDDDDVLSNIDVASPVKLNPITPTRTLPARAARSRVEYNFSTRPKTPKTQSPKTKTPRSKSKRQQIADNRVMDSDMIIEETSTKTKATAPRIVKADTVRNRVREEIATTTKAKRDAFLIHHKDYFLPLLPPNNYISKLLQANDTRQGHVPYTPLSKQPTDVVATMKPYQLTGLSFLANMYENAMPAILGDEMGLGKTLQTLSLIQHLEETHPSPVGIARPYLVVCPLSVLGSWCDEARKWTPKLKVLRFHGSTSERDEVKLMASGVTDRYGNATGRNKTKRGAVSVPVNEGSGTVFDIMVTNYETFQSEASWFKQAFVWRYCILDEGHKIKNDKTNISLALQGLQAEHRLLLTGTPLQNDLREMWALLHWLYPNVFIDKTADLFKEAFDIGRGQVDSSFMDHARHLLELVMIRRMKSSPGVDLGLPSKSEVLLYIPLTPLQRFWYTRLLTKAGGTLLDDIFGNVKQKEEEAMIKEVEEDAKLGQVKDVTDNDFTTQSRALIEQAISNEATGEKDTSAYKKLMNIVMQLRKTCITPYMIKGAAPDPYYYGDHIMHASGKFIVLNKIIDELVMKQKKKILIFSGFTSALDYCEDLLATKGSNQHDAPFRHVRFDGSTQRAVRNLQIRLFNDLSSEYKVMLISTRAGGLGLNLTAASDVIFLDEDWNPQVTLQAEARSHRIGQTKPVTIYKLLSSGTVEEQMMGRIRKKLYLSAKITESMQDIHSTNQPQKRKRATEQDETSADDGPELGFSQLKSLIRRGATTLTHPEIDVSEMVTWDLETIIEKCKDKPIDPHVGGESEEATEKEWLAKMERVESAVLDGVKYQKSIDKTAAATTDLSRADRRIDKNTTVMVDGFAINKESMNCNGWEAVPTLAGKDPRLADPKREKAAPINHQEICQSCFDGGEMYLCSGCPRAYHLACLSKQYQAKATSKMNFHCPQHDCHDCEKSTGNAGGLIYRCRWCHKGYCEDCLVPDSQLLGETIPEYAVLDYPPKRNAWYIHCTECKESQEDPAFGKLIASMAKQHDKEYAELLQAQQDNMAQNTQPDNLMPPSRDESMTDGITLESSGQATPLEFARQGKRPMEFVDLADDDADDIVDLTGEGASKFLPMSIDEDLQTTAGAPMYKNNRSKAKKRRTH